MTIRDCIKERIEAGIAKRGHRYTWGLPPLSAPVGTRVVLEYRQLSTCKRLLAVFTIGPRGKLTARHYDPPIPLQQSVTNGRSGPLT